MVNLLFVSNREKYVAVPEGVREVFLINADYFEPDDCLEAAASLKKQVAVDLRVLGSNYHYNSGLYAYGNQSCIGYFTTIDASLIQFIGWEEQDSPKELNEIWEKVHSGELFMEGGI